MKKETLKKIFEFLKENENNNAPFLWKWVSNEPLTEDDLHINGDLDLTFSRIESLPEGLNISGDLNLSFCENISSLPKGLIVRRNLILEDCSQLYSLPKGLKVGGTLYINTSPLGEYSEGQLRNMVGDDGYLKRIHYL
jgi:hypothetical protein